MRIVYLGTPDFAVAPLKAIVENTDNQVVAVVCNHDKPVGRKQVLTPPPVKVYALEKGIPVFQYNRIRKEGAVDLKKLNADLFITCAFGQILSQEIIDIPKIGVYNIHASLLPKYRGASPINFAILNGEKKTGVTIMRTDAGIDTGDMIYQQEIEIGDTETCGELFDKLSILGSKCILKVLNDLKNGEICYTKQDSEKATFTKIITKELAKIDWNNSAKNIVNQIRAFNPSPVAFTLLNGEPLKIYKAEVYEKSGKIGEVLENEKRLIIGCGDKSISVLSLQKAGGKQMNITDFLRGNKLEIGCKLGL